MPRKILSLFISFEGGEGSGKSTQSIMLRDRLQSAGYKTLLVHEPGTTPLGQYLRSWLKREKSKNEDVSILAELLLFASARAELVSKVIGPSLTEGSTIVISDRYTDSTVAYQGFGRRIPLKDVDQVNRLATSDTMPNLTFLLDLIPNKGLDRVGTAQSRLPLDPADAMSIGRGDKEGSRRFEEESSGFHERVRNGYLELARNEPERWRIIDATEPVDRIAAQIWSHVEELLLKTRQCDSTASQGDLPLLGNRD